MDITLHVGAHRTATTSFQACLRDNIESLRADGIDAWSPRLLRGGLFDGLGGAQPYPRAAAKVKGRVALHLARSAGRGAQSLVVSEENMIGSVRACVRARMLYPGAGARLARYVQVMDGQVRRIVLTVRALDLWWGSTLAYAVARGHSLPSRAALEMIAAAPRTWRDVVTDVAQAAPGAEIVVVPFERIAGRPAALLRACTGRNITLEGADLWRNRAPDATELTQVLEDRGTPAPLTHEDGRWRPFSALEAALLREAYVDDMHWLADGADGLATLAEDTSQAKDGINPQVGPMTEGHRDEREDGQVA